jgi:hypothetical protein
LEWRFRKPKKREAASEDRWGLVASGERREAAADGDFPSDRANQVGSSAWLDGGGGPTILVWQAATAELPAASVAVAVHRMTVPAAPPLTMVTVFPFVSVLHPPEPGAPGLPHSTPLTSTRTGQTSLAVATMDTGTSLRLVVFGALHETEGASLSRAASAPQTYEFSVAQIGFVKA